MKFIITESQKKELLKKYLNEQDGDISISDIGRQALDYAKNLIRNQDNSSPSKSSSVSSHIGASSSSSLDMSSISDTGKKLLENPTFKTKLSEIANAINISENSIIKLMEHESKLNPSAKNPIGCVGLIQFCPDNSGGTTKTINGKTYSLEDLRTNLDTQMDVIKEFWLSGYKSGKIKKPADLYIFNFFPIAAGKSDDYVLQTNSTSAQTIAKSNPIFNRVLGREKSTPLTVGDLNQYYQKTGMV